MAAERVARAVVIGDGSWGTALALLLVRNGVATTLWSAFPEHVEELRRDRENRRFLPGVELPPELELSADAFPACADVELAVCAVPTQYVRGVAQRFEEALSESVPIVSATKGLEVETFLTPTRILREVLGERPLAVLTGPSHAEEVARGLPASIVAASELPALAELVQAAFGSETFRVYTHADPLGAELAAALKNVIALAAGICDGLGLGDNAKAALVNRGLVEMARFGKIHGGKAETFFGLAGLGDLVVTCFSKHSRNRRVGERIGAGETLEQVLAGMQMVAEGVWTTRALFGPEAEDVGVAMPIAEQVHAVLFEEKPARQAVADLMGRAPTGEMSGLLAEGA